MKIIKKTNDKIIFKAKMDGSLANAIRRYLNHIPVSAIDEVEISKNDSPLYDETIAHRLGLIPIKAGKTGGKNLLGLKLNKKKEGFVYSGDLSGSAEVIFDKIPITFLKKDEEIKLGATIKTGKGKEHSKFSPGLMFYGNVVDIKIDKDCPKEIVEVCPKGIFKLKEGKIVAENKEECDECGLCVEECEKRGKDSIEIIPTGELIITIESFGQLDVKDIFRKSIDELKKDLKEVSKKI